MVIPTDDEIRSSPPKRPALLGLLIDAQNEQFEAFDEKYKAFLKLAWQAQQDMETSALVVTANVSTKLDKAEETEVKGGWVVVKKTNFLNSSFSNLFDLYKTYNGEGNSSTFDALDAVEDSLATENILSLLRDLQVMPKLISREGFSRVWTEMSLEMVARKEKPLVRLNLDQFKEFMVRVALFVFNAVGMRKAILACSGIIPTPGLMVQYFLHYIRLDDEAFITEHIQDTRAERLDEQVNRGNDPHIVDPLKSLLPEDNKQQFEQVDPKPTRKMLKEAKEKEKQRDDTVKKTGKTATLSKRREARQARSPLSKFAGASMLPPEIRALLDDPATNTHIMSSKAARSDEKKLTKAEEKAEEQRLKESALLKAKMDKLNQPPPRNNYADLYSPLLLDAVNSYCQPKPGKAVIEGKCPSWGSFSDMGNVEPGSLCTIRLHLHNRSPNDMNIDVFARGFEDENSKVTKDPKPLVAGLSRTVTYHFHAPTAPRSLIGHLEVTVSNTLQHFDDTIKVPVFLYISPHPLMGSKREIPTLTVDTLPQTMEKYLPTFFDDLRAAVNEFDSSSQMGSQMSSIQGSSYSVVSSATHATPASLNSYRGTSFATKRDTWYAQERVGGGGVKLDAFTASRTVTKAALREKAASVRGASRAGTGSAFPMPMKSRQRDLSTGKFFASNGADDGDNDTFAMSTLGDPLNANDSHWDV